MLPGFLELPEADRGIYEEGKREGKEIGKVAGGIGRIYTRLCGPCITGGGHAGGKSN